MNKMDPPARVVQPAAKKLKISAPINAFVPAVDHKVVDRGEKKGKVPVEDTKPLENRKRPRTDKQGLPIRKSSQNGGNEDEIDLDDENEVEDINMDRSEGEESDGPAYIDTSEPPPLVTAPPPDLEALEIQARIDALLASIEEGIPPEVDPVADEGEESLLPPAPADLPPRPPFIHPGFTMGGGSRGGHGRQRGGTFSDTASVASSRPSHGERNAKWFVDYYDASFNENPWKKLESEKGITSVGTWLAPNDRFRQDV